MTDRQLLALAAKAADMELTWDVTCRVCWLEGTNTIWNPLTDDGDALRLAVKLKLWVHVEEYGASARKAGGAWIGCESHLYGGIEQATRRAIVRAAAEIGRASQAAEERKS